ncbi:cell division protein FtsW (lipid II flippase) [Paenibacillus eucommiae]|uniref:Cell division protein FtsW (Lipid II flippase) n=1 Tax=Paenibacillus eucommiae TaxID=1355755 RepID=A0ABS4J3N9_9BACL|nr:cell division protein FtsW (lipid II flippase) [Paenibacillus eucommiae]
MKDVLYISIIIFIPFMLVLIQPDLGNASIYLVVLIGMLWIGNIKYTHAFVTIIIFISTLTLFYFLYIHYHDDIKHIFQQIGVGHWANRLDAFIDPTQASKDETYHVKNAMTAIGSGGLYGEGYLKGTSVHASYIPYSYSDSIFVVVSEEFGFLGSATLLLLYFLLIYRLITIAVESKSRNGSLIVVGIASMFVFQIFENVGMMMGIIPLTGITLPFISYGGTSLLLNMLSIGIVMSIKIYDKENEDYI